MVKFGVVAKLHDHPPGMESIIQLTGGCVVSDLNSARKCDILVFPGGEDISPSIYGERKTYTSYIDEKRDIFETDMFSHIRAMGKKILGICRGHQLINALLGGTLYQDIYAETQVRHGTFENHSNLHWKNLALAVCMPEINSLHHQAVKRPGEGMEVILRSKDGIIESTVSKDLSIITFQFHPEWNDVGVLYFEKVLNTGQLIWE